MAPPSSTHASGSITPLLVPNHQAGIKDLTPGPEDSLRGATTHTSNPCSSADPTPTCMVDPCPTV